MLTEVCRQILKNHKINLLFFSVYLNISWWTMQKFGEVYLKQLNWLSMENLFEYSFCTFIHKILQTSEPVYSKEKLRPR